MTQVTDIRTLFSHVIRNHEKFDEDDWQNLTQFDKDWESIGFEKARTNYFSANAKKMRQVAELSTEDLTNKSKGKQTKVHRQQGKANSLNSTKQVLNGWKCHSCGFNPNYENRFECYKCKTNRPDLDSYRETLSVREKRYLNDRIKEKERNIKHEKELKEVKELGYKYFDWLNGWKTTPAEVKECERLKHERQDNQYSWSGSMNLVRCNTCRYYYYYDCS